MRVASKIAVKFSKNILLSPANEEKNTVASLSEQCRRWTIRFLFSPTFSHEPASIVSLKKPTPRQNSPPPKHPTHIPQDVTAWNQ